MRGAWGHGSHPVSSRGAAARSVDPSLGVAAPMRTEQGSRRCPDEDVINDFVRRFPLVSQTDNSDEEHSYKKNSRRYMGLIVSMCIF